MNKLNKKVICVICLLLAAMMSLSACQLAVPEMKNPDAENPGGAGKDGLAIPDAENPEGVEKYDRLMGVLLTKGPMEEFDPLALIEDGEYTEYTDDGRVYGTVSEDGSIYKFGDIEGTVLALHEVDENCYGFVMRKGLVSKFNYFVNDSDEGAEHKAEHKIEGTVWVSADVKEVILYMNPIYRTPDGRVYMMSGKGSYFEPGGGYECTESLSGETTRKENGETYIFSVRVEITVITAAVDETITVIQINENGEEIKRETFLADNMPEEFTTQAGTACLLVRCSGGGSDRWKTVQPDDVGISVTQKYDETFCTPHAVPVRWS